MNSNYTNALIKRTFEWHLDPTCGFFGIRLAKTFNLLPKRMKLGLHEFDLNSKCFFKNPSLGSVSLRVRAQR